MKRHERVTVAGDDVRPGGDKGGVDVLHEGGCFQQRQRRPFGLGKGRAEAQQLAAHAAVKDEKGMGHAVSGVGKSANVAQRSVFCNGWL